jgi:hypothetical protein
MVEGRVVVALMVGERRGEGEGDGDARPRAAAAAGATGAAAAVGDRRIRATTAGRERVQAAAARRARSITPRVRESCFGAPIGKRGRARAGPVVVRATVMVVVVE